MSLCGELFECHGRRAWRGVGFGCEDADAALGEQFEAHVATVLGPFIALFGQDGPDEADQRVAAGEDPDHVGAPADLLVQPFDRYLEPAG